MGRGGKNWLLSDFSHILNFTWPQTIYPDFYLTLPDLKKKKTFLPDRGNPVQSVQ